MSNSPQRTQQRASGTPIQIPCTLPTHNQLATYSKGVECLADWCNLVVCITLVVVGLTAIVSRCRSRCLQPSHLAGGHRNLSGLA